MENTYKKLVRDFVANAKHNYEYDPSGDGRATLIEDTEKALNKWNLTVDDILSEKSSDDIDYEKVALQLIFDIGYSASIAKDCQMYEEYHLLLSAARSWRHELPDGHSARMIKTNGAYAKEIYTEYCDKYGLIKNR